MMTTDSNQYYLFLAEIEERGGEVSIEHMPYGQAGWAKVQNRTVTPVSESSGLVLLRAEGWRYYSRRFGAKHATLAYLCGSDDGGIFAVRVPGTCKTVAEALDFLTPAAVRKAEQAGRRILRQGDIFIVETIRDCSQRSSADLPSGHAWEAETRTLTHGEHAPVEVPFPAKFIPQSALRMGRSSGRGHAD